MFRTHKTKYVVMEHNGSLSVRRPNFEKNGDGFSVVDVVPVYGLMDQTLQYWQGHSAFLSCHVPRNSFGQGSLPKGKVVEVCS